MDPLKYTDNFNIFRIAHLFQNIAPSDGVKTAWCDDPAADVVAIHQRKCRALGRKESVTVVANTALGASWVARRVVQ